MANTCSNTKQLLPTVVFHGDLLYRVAIGWDFSKDTHLEADNELQLGHVCCTMWQVAGIIPAATVRWQSIKLLWESFFCTGRWMLWKISFCGWICPANGKYSIGVKEWMTWLLLMTIKSETHLNESHTKTWCWIKVLYWKSLVMISQYLDILITNSGFPPSVFHKNF